MKPRFLPLVAVLSVLAGCAGSAKAPSASSPQDAFMAELASLCGKAFEGRIAAKVGGSAGPDPFEGKTLTLHVRECAPGVVRVPFHVGDDRSRTWVFTRTAAGLRLKHDHRHQDGTPDAMNLYGGDAVDAGTRERQSFPADQASKDMFVKGGIPQSAENVWVVGLIPGRSFSYALTRPGREFRVEFDLTRPVSPPPAPWGSEP
ncbi:MAG: hypothetical protein SF051_09860 [Elusimicrobiota bacterium]|nr:hypothetical protein [Elusimicrobiota bacterium]